jgi:hypothetical protein
MDIDKRIKHKYLKTAIENMSYSQKKLILKFIRKKIKSLKVDYLKTLNFYTFQFNISDITDDDYTKLICMIKNLSKK